MSKANASTRAARALNKSDYVQLAAWRYSLRRFLRFSEDAAYEAGVTPQQHQALLAIQGMPGREEATMGELAERLQLRHHSTVELVDRLEAAGLARRNVSAEDARQVRLTVSANGLKLLEKLTLSHRDELKRIGPELADMLSAVVTAAAQEAAV